MPEDRPRFTYVVKGRYWRFRRGSIKAPLPGKPGEIGFLREYARLLELADQKAPKPDETTLAWLIDRYKESAEFAARKPATQDDYARALAIVKAELGDQPFSLITPLMAKAVRDDLAKRTPRQAHKVKQILSLLYTWAGENGHVPLGHNPAAKFRRIKGDTKPITPWSEYEIRVALGSAPAWLKTPLMLALYTGQRRQDVVGMEWQDYQGAFIRVRQSKTGEPLDIACHKDLRAHLDSIRTQFGGRIARTAKGRPFTANSLSQALRRFIDTTGCIPRDRSMHGLRYAAAARLNEAGCTVTEAVAVMGHRTYQMALKYMDQRRASEAAMARQEARDQ